jgi:integrase
VDLGPDPATGRRRQQLKGGFRTKKAAEDALHEVLGQVKSGAFVPATRVTVKEFLEGEWLPAVRARLRAGTLATYTTMARSYIVPAIGALPLSAVEPSTLNGLYGELLESGGRAGKGLAPKTVRHVHQVMRTSLADAVRWGRVQRNVADLADPPVVPRNEMAVWSPEQLGIFLRHVRDDRLYAMWLLFTTTGLRRAEVVGLPWRAVDLEARRLSVVQTATLVERKVRIEEATKTARSRRLIALDGMTVSGLRSWRARQAEERLAWGPAWQDSGLVFTHEDGTGIHPQWVTRELPKLARAADLPPLNPHGLRHAYATAALASGESLKLVSTRLGHSSTSITSDLYQHVTPEHDQAAAERVARLILGP